jgi:2-hydroxy-6-oxonona-2,4-dienedioate hydrolase
MSGTSSRSVSAGDAHRRGNPALARLFQPGQAAKSLIERYEQRARRPTLPGRTHRIAWREWGEGEPVVLLHGSAGSWAHWIRTIDALADRHRVLIPDLPGCGDSDDPEPPGDYPSVTDALARDLAALAGPGQALRLVGFSLGAQFAMRLALHGTLRTAQLVIVGSNVADRRGRTGQSSLVNWTRAETEAEALAALRANLQSMMLADPANIDPLALELYVADVVRCRMRLPSLGPFRPMVEAIPELAPHIRLTAVSGARDQIFAEVLPHQQASLDRLRPGARFHLLPDAGHWVMYESADAFNRLLRDTLAPHGDSHPPARPTQP